ncbi:hypothetical protein ACFY36_51075 [Actinoplanes sp. NPDC000266]
MSDPDPRNPPRDTARVVAAGLLIALAWIFVPAVPLLVARLLPHTAGCAQLGDVLSLFPRCAGAATVLVVRGFLRR